MSSRRLDGHTKRASNSFSIEALIGDERRNDVEEQTVQRQTVSVELEDDRLNRTHQRHSDSTQRRDNDDNDTEESDKNKSLLEGRHTPDELQQQQQAYHYQHHLHQLRQMFTRPVIESAHPLLLTTAASPPRLDSVLRRAPDTAAAPHHPTSLYCCPPQGSTPPSCLGVVSQRPAGSRDDMFPFYTWLLSRHGAFFNHRIHPAGMYRSRPCILF